MTLESKMKQVKIKRSYVLVFYMVWCYLSAYQHWSKQFITLLDVDDKIAATNKVLRGWHAY